MSFKIVIFAVAVFACQVNAQLSIVRPFATGFTNGFSEMAKPFLQLGQTVMSPVADYFSGDRRPQVSQWMSYPSQIIPQAQAAAYEGYEAITSGMPGAGYTQIFRPRPNLVYKPQPQYYPVPSQVSVSRPARPYPVPVPVPVPAPAPAPAPASSQAVSLSSEESDETYVPSSLLITPESAEVNAPKPAGVAIEENINIPSLQRPLPVLEDKE